MAPKELLRSQLTTLNCSTARLLGNAKCLDLILGSASLGSSSGRFKFLFDHWKELPREDALRGIDYGAAIYDKHDSRRRVLMLGADYLTNEKRGK